MPRFAATLLVFLLLASPLEASETTGRSAGFELQDRVVGPLRAIEVEGLRATRREELLEDLHVDLERKIPASRLLVARERILATGRFQDVSLRLEPMKGGQRLIVTVVERPAIGEVRVTGASRLDAAAVSEAYLPLRGKVVDHQALERAARDVGERYRKAGLTLARVAGTTLSPAGTLEVKVEEGVFERVAFTGLQSLNEPLLRREISYRPGEAFDGNAFAQDLARLRHLRLVSDMTPLPGQLPGALTLETKEANSRGINLGFGYSTQVGLQGLFGLSDWNLFGLGHQAGYNVSLDQRLRVLGDLTYHVPWLDDAHTSLGTTLYRRIFNNGSGQFRDERTGLRVFSTRPLGGTPLHSPLLALAGFQVEQVAAFDNTAVGGSPLSSFLDGRRVTADPSGRDTLAGLSLGLRHDSRVPGPMAPGEAARSPVDGWFNTLTLEPALINGGTPFLKGIAVLNRYVPLPWFPYGQHEPSVLAFSGRLGMTAGPVVPAYKRFYSADTYFDAPLDVTVDGLLATPFVGRGQNDYFQYSPFLIRGWTQFYGPDGMTLSPALPPLYYGGDNALVGTLEYRFPVWGPVYGVMFTDVGGFWNGLFDRRFIHAGYGGGLRWWTPIGPLRVDYAMGGGDFAPPRLHFGVGQLF